VFHWHLSDNQGFRIESKKLPKLHEMGSDGLYYTVGNANNGNATTFGPNGTTPDVTETTGLEVVTPLNAGLFNADQIALYARM